jgi:hypothetical protein
MHTDNLEHALAAARAVERAIMLPPLNKDYVLADSPDKLQVRM